MTTLKVNSTKEVDQVFELYPAEVKSKMLLLRKLVLETAEEMGLKELEESLKWGEPSYKARHGSTLRMDWKGKKPNQYAMYFQCSTSLVANFKLAFRDLFKYEGNRAIVFHLNDSIPEKEVKKCIKATLSYHKIKHLPTLNL